MLGIPVLCSEVGVREGTSDVRMLNAQRGSARELLREELFAVRCDLSSPGMLVSKSFLALRN